MNLLKEIKPVAKLFASVNDVLIHEINLEEVGNEVCFIDVYTAEQVQEYAKAKIKELLFEQLWNDRFYANSKILFDKEVENVLKELFKEAQDEV